MASMLMVLVTFPLSLLFTVKVVQVFRYSLALYFVISYPRNTKEQSYSGWGAFCLGVPRDLESSLFFPVLMFMRR